MSKGGNTNITTQKDPWAPAVGSATTIANGGSVGAFGALTPDAQAALQKQLSGTPDYSGLNGAITAANAPILRDLNQNIIPGLNQKATFLNNSTGGIKALNRVLPDVTDRMSQNAATLMNAERIRALTSQQSGLGLYGNLTGQANSQALQAAGLGGTSSVTSSITGNTAGQLLGNLTALSQLFPGLSSSALSYIQKLFGGGDTLQPFTPTSTTATNPYGDPSTGATATGAADTIPAAGILGPASYGSDAPTGTVTVDPVTPGSSTLPDGTPITNDSSTASSTSTSATTPADYLGAAGAAGGIGAAAAGLGGAAVPAGTVTVGAIEPLAAAAGGLGTAATAAGTGATAAGAAGTGTAAAGTGAAGTAGIGALGTAAAIAVPAAFVGLISHSFFSGNSTGINTVGPGQNTLQLQSGQAALQQGNLAVGAGNDRSEGSGQIFLAGADGQIKWLGSDAADAAKGLVGDIDMANFNRILSTYDGAAIPKAPVTVGSEMKSIGTRYGTNSQQFKDAAAQNLKNGLQNKLSDLQGIYTKNGGQDAFGYDFNTFANNLRGITANMSGNVWGS